MTARTFAIVGGGTAGLAAATFLARAGHEVTLFERYPEPSAVGAGILLQPTGMHVLRELGASSALEAVSARIDALDGRTPQGRRVMNVTYRDLASGCYGLGVHRANLLRVLRDAADAAGVRIECGSEVVDVARSPRVRVRLANGTVMADFDALVIANGTHSTLRDALGVPHSCVRYPWGALWMICPAPDGLPDRLQQRFHTASVMIGVMPTGRDPRTGAPCVSFFWSLKAADYAGWKQRALDDWKREVLDYWPEIAPTLAHITAHDQLAFARYADVRMRRWHDGNAVVIGDAAHAMSPQLGQGTNLALLDARVLAECVADNGDLGTAFAAYTKRRRGQLGFYQSASRWLTPLFQSDNRIAARLRDRTFPWIASTAWTRREAACVVTGMKQGWWPGGSLPPVQGASALDAQA